jgi:anti-anti-sigma factor
MTEEIFRLERGEGSAFFRLVGELDMSNVPGVTEELSRELEQSNELILDATGLTFTDSQGLTMLIDLGKQAIKQETIVQVANCSRQLRRLLRVAVPGGIPGVNVLDAGNHRRSG